MSGGGLGGSKLYSFSVDQSNVKRHSGATPPKGGLRPKKKRRRREKRKQLGGLHTPYTQLWLAASSSGKSNASGSHLKRCINEGPTPTATRAQSRDPPPPGRGRAFDSTSHFNPPVTFHIIVY
eukprot:957966-Pelagomonas_calceolata.AAC.1